MGGGEGVGRVYSLICIKMGLRVEAHEAAWWRDGKGRA